jgi:hypothetical protein
MKHVTLWRVGIVRTLALLIAGGALHGIEHGMRNGARWNIEAMSLPTATALMLCACAIYLLGFRTERDYGKILKLIETPRYHDRGDTDRLHDSNRVR